MTVSAAQFNVALEGLADRTAFLAAQRSLVVGAEFDFMQYLPAANLWGNDGAVHAWMPGFTSTGGLGQILQQRDVSASQYAILSPVVFPSMVFYGIGDEWGWTLETITVSLFGSAGHGALPAAMPDVSLYVNGSIVGSPTVDASSSVGAYEATHTITHTAGAAGLGNTLDAHIRIRGEAGASSQVGLDIAVRVVTHWKVTQIPEVA